MRAFATEEFKLSKRGQDGVSLRETIEVYERMSGKVSSERSDVAFPDILYDLWQHFQNLHRCRGVGMAGALGVTYLDIHAYSQLKQIRLEDWELEAIRYLDIIFLNSQSEK